MSNSLVRLKRQPDSNGEDQVVIRVQYKQKQYPIPIPAIKVKPEFFNENNYGKWLSKSYDLTDGITRSHVTINKRIKDFKTKVDVALDSLETIGIDKMSVHLIKSSMGKSEKDIKANIHTMVDSFYDEPLMKVFENEFLIDPFAEGDLKNLESLKKHLDRFIKTEWKVEIPQMKDLNKEFFDRFTWYLLGYQFKKGDKNDFYTYLTHDSVYKQIKKLRKFMNFCNTKKGKKFESFKYSFPYSGTLNTINPESLFPIELDLIYHYDKLPSLQMMAAKKLFLLAFSIGGQRISDVTYIVKERLYKNDLRTYWQQKTKKQMFSGIFDSYFSKYQQDDIPLYSGKHVNDLLKSIIKYFDNKIDKDEDFREFILKETKTKYDGIPFQRTITKKSFRGRSQTALWSKPISLYEDFSFSYARHTFISNMIFRFGKTKEEVMLYTGHRSEEIVNFYLDKKKQLESYKSDKQIVKPDERYDLELIRRLNDYSYLNSIGYFNLDTEEELIDEALNAKGLSPSDLDGNEDEEDEDDV